MRYMGNALPHLRGKSSRALMARAIVLVLGVDQMENDGPPYIGEISEYDTIILSLEKI